MEGVWQRCDTAHDPKDWRWSAGKGKAWGTAWWHIRGRRSDLFYKLSGGSWGAGCGHPWKSPWGWFWVNVRSHFEKERLLSWSLFSGAWRILSLHLIKYRPGSAWQDCRAQGRLWSVFVLRGSRSWDPRNLNCEQRRMLIFSTWFPCAQDLPSTEGFTSLPWVTGGRLESLLAISRFIMGRKEGVHSSNRELASTCSVPGTVLASWITSVNKTDKQPCSRGS